MHQGNTPPTFFVNLQPCLIGMEACGSAHHWARKLQSFGHTVRLMAPQFVKPYVKTNKNDAADAAAICEAVGRPNMRFIPVRSRTRAATRAVHTEDATVNDIATPIRHSRSSCASLASMGKPSQRSAGHP